MLRRVFATLAMLFSVFAMSVASSAATLSPTLQSQLAGAADSLSVGAVIVTFSTTNGLNESHLNVLRNVGITRGFRLTQLGMVATNATAGQVRALATNGAVRSVWSNERLYYYLSQARVLAGVDRLRTDAAITFRNGGLPVSGQGNFSVVINDSGIDGTHNDLKFGPHVIQNVQIVTDTDFNNAVIRLPELDGFFTLTTVENVPNTDTHVGHGTHCAGIVGGSGQQSGGLYAGVAPGAKLIGTGSGAGLFILNALGGYEWSLANQFIYNIRIISNSWGSSGAFNPDSPINIATKDAYDRNIISVFAAGNDGPGPDTHNPYAKAPWVISVGAGTKEGGVAGFSSRGTPKAERLADNDPNNDNDAPTIVAPGTGREFAINSAKFTSDVVSTRSLTNVVSNGADADLEIAPAFLPFYTQISGTSMATPFTTGTVALMLDADPTLNPDEVKQILQQTASQMPGYDEYQVGAGYINSHAAVDRRLRHGTLRQELWRQQAQRGAASRLEQTPSR
jgi:serine protease AprX